jgi:hypothetical protein
VARGVSVSGFSRKKDPTHSQRVGFLFCESVFRKSFAGKKNGSERIEP